MLIIIFEGVAIKSYLLGLVIFLVTGFSQAACPRAFAAGAYSGLAETFDYVSDPNVASGNAYLVQEHTVGIITVTFDGKGTTTTSGRATVTGYFKKMSKDAAEPLTSTNFSYKFYPQTCTIIMDPIANSANNNPVAIFVTDSGAELSFITYFPSDPGLIDRGRLRKQ